MISVRYTEYHVQMHQRIAGLLNKYGIVKGVSEEEMVSAGLTTPFLPHGLGHALGLQVFNTNTTKWFEMLNKLPIEMSTVFAFFPRR